MPELSRFLGIVIFMNYRDHQPPHFHARYNDYEITVELETGVITGKMPRRALNLILEWNDQHKEELRANWLLAREHKPLAVIQPLE
jgi:Domain of unknown function (DUF4160)